MLLLHTLLVVSSKVRKMTWEPLHIMTLTVCRRRVGLFACFSLSRSLRPHNPHCMHLYLLPCLSPALQVLEAFKVCTRRCRFIYFLLPFQALRGLKAITVCTKGRAVLVLFFIFVVAWTILKHQDLRYIVAKIVILLFPLLSDPRFPRPPDSRCIQDRLFLLPSVAVLVTERGFRGIKRSYGRHCPMSCNAQQNHHTWCTLVDRCRRKRKS